VVGVDLSRSSERAIEWVASQVPRHDDWVLHFVHVVDDRRLARPSRASEDAVLSLGERFEAFGELLRAGRIRFRRVLAESPAEGLVTFAIAAHAELVVVGESSRSLFAALRGATADRVARTAPCPVVIVRHSGRHAARPQRSSKS
jgi:nucleotide-binding universal stress UspA family protein